MPKLVFKLSASQSLDFPLASDHVRLGRNPVNDIVIDNSWISSFHAEFRLTPEGVTELRDLKSSNGTTVNGKRIEVARLAPGDTVAFGQLEAIFDPLPAGAQAMNGGPPPVAPLAAPSLEVKPVRLPAPGPQPVATLPRPAVTELVPPSRLLSGPPPPAAVPATVPGEKLAELENAKTRLAEMEAALTAVSASVKADEQIKASLAHELSAAKAEQEKLNAALAELQQAKAALESDAASLTKEIASLKEQREKLVAGESSLAELTTRLEEATAAIAQRQAALAKLDMDAAAAASAARTAREAQAEAMKTVGELSANQQQLAALANEMTAMEEQRALSHQALTDSAAQLETLRQQIAATRAEAASLEELRAETAALQGRAEELERTVHRLEERMQTFADAPDANWGTVHAMAKGLIKQIDLLDDLITHLVSHKGAKESIEQMKIFRAGLMDILTEYSVVPYCYEAGFTVDVSARKKIQIVESLEDSGHGTRIEKTYRPGYVCSNGPVGVQTLLRKAEVSILLGR